MSSHIAFIHVGRLSPRLNEAIPSQIYTLTHVLGWKPLETSCKHPCSHRECQIFNRDPPLPNRAPSTMPRTSRVRQRTVARHGETPSVDGNLLEQRLNQLRTA